MTARHDLIPRATLRGPDVIIVPRRIAIALLVVWIGNAAAAWAGVYARATSNHYTMRCTDQLPNEYVVCTIGGDR